MLDPCMEYVSTLAHRKTHKCKKIYENIPYMEHLGKGLFSLLTIICAEVSRVCPTYILV